MHEPHEIFFRVTSCKFVDRILGGSYLMLRLIAKGSSISWNSKFELRNSKFTRVYSSVLSRFRFSPFPLFSFPFSPFSSSARSLYYMGPAESHLSLNLLQIETARRLPSCLTEEGRFYKYEKSWTKNRRHGFDARFCFRHIRSGRCYYSSTVSQ